MSRGRQRKCPLKPGLPSHLFHPVPLSSAGWRGWGCTDSADALTYGFQLLSTLLLCLSNLMFLPPVVLAIRSRYVLEAAVYTFTMFFSTVCSGICVFTESLPMVGGESLHFHHGVWGCLHLHGMRMSPLHCTAVLPDRFVSWHANMIIFIRHIGIYEQGSLRFKITNSHWRQCGVSSDPHPACPL